MVSPERLERLQSEIATEIGAHINESDGARLKLAKRFVPHSMRDPAREALTAALRPRAEQKARELLERRPLRLNLGSGWAPIEGWVNIDLAGAPVDLCWNLKRGIPFPDDAVDAVFSEHVFEHIPLPGALTLIREARRALRPGGTFRVAVPDAGALLRSYAGTADETWALSSATRMQSVMRLFYGNGHCTMYDEELLVSLCELAGLAEVTACEFGEGRLGPETPDSEGRRAGTLYVEGVCPD